ncbi:hypothetical protein QVN42_02685 [Yersinia nurmii]|uniref:Lipoprotein n=1 Tax=Yersinia nurmii TaxID=685706 RepID=A0AAW7JU80_9GAMM|nr:hypothetical protein [Yersinia nurmii]MDN0086308.1 hypothetical protein [Yersinia nurmii]CNE48563.1 Uncharacterised protein [Yersinia nurmii]
MLWKLGMAAMSLCIFQASASDYVCENQMFDSKVEHLEMKRDANLLSLQRPGHEIFYAKQEDGSIYYHVLGSGQPEAIQVISDNELWYYVQGKLYEKCYRAESS